MASLCWPVLLFLMSKLAYVLASAGDRAYTHQKCIYECKVHFCSRTPDAVHYAQQPFYLRWTSWNCPQECDYQCMWKTVEAFQKDGSPIPQFHGKWPFIRIFGIQEPASVIFSLCNAIAHIIMFFKFRKAVPSSAPMYYIYNFYTIVSVNAWLWSTIFHSRDTPFTEKMDYFCADSVVIFCLFVFFARVLGTRQWWKAGSCFVALMALFLQHVHYLTFVRFDYGYNMKANLAVGVINAAGWLWWCSRVQHKQPHVRKAAAAIIAVSLLVLLEVGDFPPLWWVLDAHSIWHACTAPVVLLWHSFTIDDCLFLLKEEQSKLKDTSMDKEYKNPDSNSSVNKEGANCDSNLKKES